MDSNESAGAVIPGGIANTCARQRGSACSHTGNASQANLPHVSDELNSQSLLWANLSIERIGRALRQYKRLQQAWRKFSDEEERLHEEYGEQTPGSMPKSWTDLRAKLEDHVYFFVLTSRQALRASWVLEQRGEQMPQFRQQDRLRAWRDYLEHWDNPARGMRDRAGEDWRKVSDEAEPGLTYSGADEVTRISGVRIKRLRKDLKKARKAAGLISEREFDRVYITAAEAAEILGMSLAEFESLDRKPSHLDFGGDIGVRYWRDWTEARRDGRLIPPDWNDYISADRLEDDETEGDEDDST